MNRYIKPESGQPSHLGPLPTSARSHFVPVIHRGVLWVLTAGGYSGYSPWGTLGTPLVHTPSDRTDLQRRQLLVLPADVRDQRIGHEPVCTRYAEYSHGAHESAADPSARRFRDRALSRRRCKRGVSPFRAQMRMHGCGRGEPSPGADVGDISAPHAPTGRRCAVPCCAGPRVAVLIELLVRRRARDDVRARAHAGARHARPRRRAEHRPLAGGALGARQPPAAAQRSAFYSYTHIFNVCVCVCVCVCVYVAHAHTHKHRNT
jgi:hypothetical protein